MNFPMTAVYAKFVKAGLIDHLDQHGKAADLPGYVKDESRDLAPYLRERLTNEFKKQIRRIDDTNGSELLKIPDYKGDLEPKVFLQEVLSVAEKEHIEGASSALKKINVVQPTSSPPPGANDAKPPAGANDANPPAGTDVTISGSVIYDSVNRSAVEYWTTNTVTNGRITILAEEKTNRTSKSHYSSDGKQSNYFVEVQDPVTGIYRREIKPAGYVADLLPKWREAENRKIFYTYTENKTEDKTPARRKTFDKTKSGPVTKFHWFACHDQNQADQDTMSRNPTTKCCVEFEKEVGPQITLMNELKAKFMQSWDLQELIVLAAERDKMPIPQKRLPKKYTEKNLCYHNRNEVVDPFKREPSTWREIKNESYAERGITIDERAMSNGPVQYSGITTGEDGQPANRDIERIISQKLEKEKKITDLRFERIESEVHGLKNDLGKHTLYLEEILGLLKEKSPTTQTSGHTSAPISEKLKDTLGGFGNGSSVREGTLPPYTSPMPPQRRAAHIQPSIEV